MPVKARKAFKEQIVQKPKGGKCFMDIQSLRKFALYVVILLLVVAVALFFLLKFLVPHDPVKEGFMVTINGKVNTNLSDVVEYQNYVYVYYPYYNIEQLARGEKITLASIDWNNIIGEYSATFWLPIEMKVIVTADATGCNHETIYVSNRSQFARN